jgi:hypothetical protein
MSLTQVRLDELATFLRLLADDPPRTPVMLLFGC